MFACKKQKITSIIVFSIYLFLLTWLILFKFGIDFSSLEHIRSINLIPYFDNTSQNQTVGMREIILNVLVFVPVGVLLSVFTPKWTSLGRTSLAFVLSIAYEVIQYALAIGRSDVSDVIGNTLGAILGVMLYTAIGKLLRDKSVRVVNTLGIAVEALAVILIAGLTIANL